MIQSVIARSLVGEYRAERLFTLRQSVTAYRSYQTLIEDWSRDQFHSPTMPPTDAYSSDAAKGKPQSNHGVPRNELKRVFGVDLTKRCVYR